MKYTITIKEKRLALGLTLKDMGKKLGIIFSHYNKIEMGLLKTVHQLEKICEILGLDYGELVITMKQDEENARIKEMQFSTYETKTPEQYINKNNIESEL